MKSNHSNTPANTTLHLTSRPHPLRRLAAFCLFSLGLFSVLASAQSGQAQVEETAATTSTATIRGQYAATVATSNTITMTRTPITVGTTTVYWDITTTLTPTFSSAGALTGFTSVVTKAVPSPVLLVANFKPGTYIGPASLDSGQDAIVVSGPSAGAGGTLWSIRPATGGNYIGAPTPSNGSFWVGTLSTNPDISAARFKAAGITTAGNWSFGMLGDGSRYQWFQGDLIGAQQVGNTIVIADFTLGGVDQSTPEASYTYTLVP